jgi:hypothetical protein
VPILKIVLELVLVLIVARLLEFGSIFGFGEPALTPEAPGDRALVNIWLWRTDALSGGFEDEDEFEYPRKGAPFLGAT